HSLGDARIALVSLGLQDVAQDFTAEFDYVRVSTWEEGRNAAGKSAGMAARSLVPAQGSRG
ncbi:MAG TPA: hypothetical protein VGP10_01350, partial [Marisediminicola sp.]|nr:hypothetical protein [Marisediminicola sp.]